MDMPKGAPMHSLNTDHVELVAMRDVMTHEEQALFDLIAQAYGGNSERIINVMMDITVRAAILAGVPPESFAAGMKAHWDYYADEMNRRQA